MDGILQRLAAGRGGLFLVVVMLDDVQRIRGGAGSAQFLGERVKDVRFRPDLLVAAVAFEIAEFLDQGCNGGFLAQFGRGHDGGLGDPLLLVGDIGVDGRDALVKNLKEKLEERLRESG